MPPACASGPGWGPRRSLDASALSLPLVVSMQYKTLPPPSWAAPSSLPHHAPRSVLPPSAPLGPSSTLPPPQIPSTAMGNRYFLTDEQLPARATANSYQRGAHKAVDEVHNRGKHVTKTVKDQDRTLRRYVL